MSLMSTSEAAAALGVTPRQVQKLVGEGALRRVVRGHVDARSVDQLLAVRRGSHGRVWTEATAWAAVTELSGKRARIGQGQRSRLTAQLRRLTAEELVVRARNRARVRRFRGIKATRERLRHELAGTSTSTLALGLADDPSVVDAYVNNLQAIVERHSLVEDAAGNIVLRATGMDLETVRDLQESANVLTALDLAESTDPRTQGVGLAALREVLRGR